MAAAVQHLEEILKEYLIFRGFTNTLKTFEAELKADRDKGFRVNKIVEQLISFVTNYDLHGMREYWGYLRRRFFSRLDSANLSNAQKLEKCLYRFYLVNAVQTLRPDKVTDFFEKMASELQSQMDWKEWFVLPFLKNPEHNPTLEMYFSQLWQETFPLSLHNFLNAIFQSMPLPRLLKFDSERIMSEKLRQDNNLLHQEITKLQQEIAILQGDQITGNCIELQQRLEKSKVVDKKTEDKFVDKVQDYDIQADVKCERSNEEVETKAETSRQDSDITDVSSVEKYDDNMRGRKMFSENSGGEIAQESESVFQTENDVKEEVIRDSMKEDHYLEKPKLEKTKSSGSLSRTKPTDPDTRELIDMTNYSDAVNRAMLNPFLKLSQETFIEHRSPIVQCDFSSSGKLVASVDSDGIVKVWRHHPDISTVATVMSKSSLLSIEWTKKADKFLLLGTNNGKIRLYDTENKTARCDVSTDSHFTRVESLACSPSGTSFVCAATEEHRTSSMSSVLKHALSTTDQEKNAENTKPGTLLLWDLKTMKLERPLSLGSNPTRINCIAYNHNGTLLVTGGADGVIRLYDTRSNDCLMNWSAHHGPINTVQFSVDETSVFSMGRDNKFSQWSLHSGKRTASLLTHNGMFGPPESVLTGRMKNIMFTRLFTFDCTAKHLLTCSPTSSIIYNYNKPDNSLSQVFSIGENKSHVTSVDWYTAGDLITCLTGSMNGHIAITQLLKH